MNNYSNYFIKSCSQSSNFSSNTITDDSDEIVDVKLALSKMPTLRMSTLSLHSVTGDCLHNGCSSRNRAATSDRSSSTMGSIDEKSIKKLELGPILRDKNVLFHSIGNDIYRLSSILSNGILSKAEARSKGVFFPTTFGTAAVNGYNGENYISLCRSPSHEDSVGYNAGAFNVYAKRGISFVVSSDRVIPMETGSSVDSGIPGECFRCSHIPKADFKGIMLQNGLLEKPFSEINFLEGGGGGTIHLRSQYLYEYISQQTDFHDQEVLSFIQNPAEKYEDREQYEKVMNKYVVNAYNSFGITNMRDLLISLIPSEMNVYDSFGFKITL